jgi:hypothetical protein
VLTLASTSDAAGIALGAPKARRRQRFKMLRVQTRGTGRANEACARRWSGCPVRPCFWPSTLLFRTLTCATAAGHGSLDGTFVFSSPWRPEPNAKDGSKTSLKVAWHHTPTHSLYARSPSQALVGLLHKCSTSTPFLPSSHPLHSSLNTLRDHCCFLCPSCLSACTFLLWFCSCLKCCHR